MAIIWSEDSNVCVIISSVGFISAILVQSKTDGRAQGDSNEKREPTDEKLRETTNSQSCLSLDARLTAVGSEDIVALEGIIA